MRHILHENYAKFIFCVLALYLFNVSCQQHKNQAGIKFLESDKHVLIRQVIDSNGKITEEDELSIKNKDTVVNGHSKWFFKNGNLKKVASITNGVYNGFCFYYHPNGHIDAKEHFLQGRHAGRQCSYYPNGKMKSIVYVPIQHIDTVGTFVARYDTLGNIIDIIGKTVLIFTDTEVYKVGDTVTFICDVAKVNKLHTQLTLKLTNGFKTAIDTTINDFDYIPSSDMTYYVLNLILPKGDYTFSASTRLIDSVTNKLVKEDFDKNSFRFR